jgi:hypothetical protein
VPKSKFESPTGESESNNSETWVGVGSGTYYNSTQSLGIMGWEVDLYMTVCLASWVHVILILCAVCCWIMLHIDVIYAAFNAVVALWKLCNIEVPAWVLACSFHTSLDAYRVFEWLSSHLIIRGDGNPIGIVMLVTKAWSDGIIIVMTDATWHRMSDIINYLPLWWMIVLTEIVYVQAVLSATRPTWSSSLTAR